MIVVWVRDRQVYSWFGSVPISPLRPLRLCGLPALVAHLPQRRRGRRGYAEIIVKIGHHRWLWSASGQYRHAVASVALLTPRLLDANE
jgi:hypothetical protein